MATRLKLMPSEDPRLDMLRDLQLLRGEYEKRLDCAKDREDREHSVRLIVELAACIDRLEKDIHQISRQ